MEEFRLNEVEIEVQFRRHLNNLLPGVMLMRAATLDEWTPEVEMGVSTIVSDKLKRQDNPDVLRLIELQIADALALGTARHIGTTKVNPTPLPLLFTYVDGEFEVDGEMVKGTKVVTGTTFVQEEEVN